MKCLLLVVESSNRIVKSAGDYSDRLKTVFAPISALQGCCKLQLVRGSFVLDGYRQLHMDKRKPFPLELFIIVSGSCIVGIGLVLLAAIYAGFQVRRGGPDAQS